MSEGQDISSRLRGALPASEPGARGLEYMARNPGCQRLTALTVAAVSPAEVSRLAYSRKVEEGLSPFAIRRGERFEEALFADKGKRLFTAYQEADRLDRSENGFLDLSNRFPGSEPEVLDARLKASLDLVRQRLQGRAGLPNLVVKPRLVISLLGHSFACEPDALVAADDDRFWRVVEIKSYADRRSRTDTQKTGAACRQAAVGLLALAEATGQSCPALADLVFARPGTNWPRLHTMDISAELESLEMSLRGAPEVAEATLEALAGRSIADREVLESIPNNLCSGCSEHCALWLECFSNAVKVDTPDLLGEGAQEILVGVSTLQHALELRDRGCDPNGDLDLLAQLLAGSQREYQKSLGEL